MSGRGFTVGAGQGSTWFVVIRARETRVFHPLGATELPVLLMTLIRIRVWFLIDEKTQTGSGVPLLGMPWERSSPQPPNSLRCFGGSFAETGNQRPLSIVRSNCLIWTFRVKPSLFEFRPKLDPFRSVRGGPPPRCQGPAFGRYALVQLRNRRINVPSMPWSDECKFFRAESSRFSSRTKTLIVNHVAIPPRGRIPAAIRANTPCFCRWVLRRVPTVQSVVEAKTCRVWISF